MNNNGYNNFNNQNNNFNNDDIEADRLSGYYTNNGNTGYNNYGNNSYNNNYNNYGNNPYNNNYGNNPYNYGNNPNNFGNNYNQNYMDNIPLNPPSISKKKILIYILITIAVVVGIVLFVLAMINLLTSYEITYELNGATRIKNPPAKCKSNVFGHCYVTLPDAVRENGEIVGYSYVSDTQTAKFKVGEKVELTEDTKLYVISKLDRKITFDTSAIDEIDSGVVSCPVYNKEESCQVTLPHFNKKGYLNIGYSTKKDDLKSKLRPGDKYVLKGDVTLYPTYNKYNLGKNDIAVSDVVKSVKLNNVYIDITSSCSATIADKAVKYIKYTEELYPFVFNYNKITLMSTKEFAQYTGESDNVKGITFWDGEVNVVPTVFLPCEEGSSDIYPVAFHEIMHVFDSQNWVYNKKYFSKDKEIYDIASKYFKYNASDRPLRDYAYANAAEFFAELLTYYHFNYVDTSYQISGIISYKQTLPDDLKKLAEKYICIGKNNYNRSNC